MALEVTPPRVMGHAPQQESLAARYRSVREASASLCRPLELEDYGLQAMADASPPKWHLAHTTWFFETFLLQPFLPGYRVFHPQYEYLFNSYYQALGPQYPRAERGLLSRPTAEEVYRYRAHVDAAMTELFESGSSDEVLARAMLGCHHEQQHQELLLTDIKYSLSVNPLRPAYRPDLPASPSVTSLALTWLDYPSGLAEIGHDASGFAFDNEAPRHRVFLPAFALASRLVTCGEYMEFIDAGGYRSPEYWLADGWRAARERQWQAPLYWERGDERWWHYTLAGMRPLNESEPVCHISFYEADAYARFVGKRLPTEMEWEVAAASQVIDGNLREHGALHPRPAPAGKVPAQLFGDVWEWTQSAYAPYPGFRPVAGALGEYNGKFMVNQMVLRGGSCVTPADHVRASYRNFFYPADRWQFSGLRLAQQR